MGISKKICCPLPAIYFCSMLACSCVAMPLYHGTHKGHQSRSRATSLETYSSLRIPWAEPRFLSTYSVIKNLCIGILLSTYVYPMPGFSLVLFKTKYCCIDLQPLEKPRGMPLFHCFTTCLIGNLIIFRP